MFHSPFNDVFEWVTVGDAGRLAANVCEDGVPKEFWRAFYNISGGESMRVVNHEFANAMASQWALPIFAPCIDPIGSRHATSTAETIAINYFGAVATLEGLRPLLANSPRPRAVAICSTAALLPTDDAVVNACLAGNEVLALAEMRARPQTAYMSSKRALSLWLRRAAVADRWAGAGILLNGVAPGVMTARRNGRSSTRNRKLPSGPGALSIKPSVVTAKWRHAARSVASMIA